MVDPWSVSAMASRLRVLQDELADAPAEERRSRLATEVRQELEQRAFGDRSQFVKAMLSRFPVEGGAAAAMAPAPKECAECRRRAMEPVTPMRLAEQLLASLKDAKAEDKAAVAKLLREAGVGGGGSGITPELERQIRKDLDIKDGEQVDAARFCEVGAKALSGWLVLYNSAAGVRSKLVTLREEHRQQPAAKFDRVTGVDLQRLMGDYVARRSAAQTREDVNRGFDGVRRVCGLFFNAAMNLGEQMWLMIKPKLDPAQIEEEAVRRGRLLSSKEAIAWEIYRTERWKETGIAGWGKQQGWRAMSKDLMKAVEDSL